MSRELFIDDDWCFCCGKNNPHGLKMEFEKENNEVVSKIVLDKKFQGYKDIVHGGIVCTLLDEVSAQVVYKKGIKCVTAKITVKLKKPVYTNKQIILRARLIKESSSYFICEADLFQDKILKAQSQAMLVRV